MTFRSILTMACCAAALLAPASAAPRPGDAKLRDDLDVAYNTCCAATMTAGEPPPPPTAR